MDLLLGYSSFSVRDQIHHNGVRNKDELLQMNKQKIIIKYEEEDQLPLRILL